jgi:hypothetical protein
LRNSKITLIIKPTEKKDSKITITRQLNYDNGLHDWKIEHQAVTHAYAHLLVDVHSAGFAPAFTLSFHDSERSRKPPLPIVSVVSCNSEY